MTGTTCQQDQRETEQNPCRSGFMGKPIGFGRSKKSTVSRPFTTWKLCSGDQGLSGGRLERMVAE